MTLNEAIEQLSMAVAYITDGGCESLWTEEDIEAVEALLAALVWHPIDDPPNDARWVLVKHIDVTGDVACDRGYYDNRQGVHRFYIRLGDNCEAIGWRELPEANEPPETVFTEPLPRGDHV